MTEIMSMKKNDPNIIWDRRSIKLNKPTGNEKATLEIC